MAWTPSNLFTDQSEGLWLDISDTSTLFQDASATVPVDSDDQEVRRINDKSGSGKHFYCDDQEPNPPRYRTDGIRHWLDFNGIMAFMKTTSQILGASAHAISIGFQTRSLQEGKQYDIVEFSTGGGTNGGRLLFYLGELYYQTGSSVAPTRVPCISPITTNPTTTIARFDGTGMSLKVNELQAVVNSNNNYVAPGAGGLIGMERKDAQGYDRLSQYYNGFYGKIFQVVALSNRGLTDNEAAELNTYLGYMSGAFGSIPTAGQTAKVSGVVQIDGTPAQRTVRAFGYDPTAHDLDGSTVNLSKSLGHSTSDSETGDYTIDLLAGYGQEIFVVAFDDYGDAFIAEQALAAGDRIHPTTPNGHVWETTGAGALPVDEPTWVVDTETSQLYGTASMIARPFYRPMVHGPIMPEVSEAAPGDEHWDSVALLLHFNGEVGATEFVDSSTAARNVTAVNAPALIQDGRFFEAIEFEGTNQYITIPGGPWTNLSQWTDYTLEFYIYNENGGVFLTTNVGTGTYRTFMFISDKVRFRIISDGNAEVVELDTGINSLPSFAWKHVAITKKGQLWRAFIDGQLLSESLEAVAHQTIEPDMNIGIRRDGLAAPYSGRVEEFRVTPGVCRYEADFVPPTAQFLEVGTA